ncbi:GNAT family N-acetyltransferase [Marinilactibacillus kalidii]|uniref:GNAT family N-acetyltransferase n=1 Tax=Marinilactibacillus kalidii TaxID=2820274 RepID=UPI001ABE615A|nr:GNAT family N-acetyltransferase [Marinilactibacillus kalidii]
MLTNKQLSDIEALQREVEIYDEIALKLNWDMLRMRNTNKNDLFFYKENDLVGFIGLYAFGSTVEITGMIKPSERRNGYFTTLFAEAMNIIRENGYNKTLLNAPKSALSAKQFLKKQGAVYSFTEYQMKWQPTPIAFTSGFSLREATSEDLDLRVQLNVDGFGIEKAEALKREKELADEMANDADSDEWMIDVDRQPIGMIRVTREGNEAWIYGFSILPLYQGKGIGRKVLQSIVKQKSEKGYTVHLEVETENNRALSLYESVGFEVVQGQDYYTYN